MKEIIQIKVTLDQEATNAFKSILAKSEENSVHLNVTYSSAGSREALVVQAFKFMRQKHIDQIMLQTTKQFLKGTTRRNFEKNLKFAPHWIKVLLQELQ